MLSTYGPRFGLDREIGLKVSGAFGGGMARLGETCGAVTGALMVIGLKHGKITAGDDESREKTYELARDFTERFKSRNNAILCRELLGYDLNTEEGRDAVAEKNLFLILCPRYVLDAVQILEDVLSR